MVIGFLGQGRLHKVITVKIEHFQIKHNKHFIKIMIIGLNKILYNKLVLLIIFLFSTQVFTAS